MSFRLTDYAKADLRDIGRYTRTQWGRAQAITYLQALDEVFLRLGDAPFYLGSSALDVRPEGCRAYMVGSHWVIYRTEQTGILVLRVLHQRMNIAQHLRDA